MRYEQITDPLCYHGEGPVWSPSWGGLRWVDMLAGDLMTLRPDGSVDRLPTGSPVAAFVRPRESGGYVVGIEHGLALADDPFSSPRPWLRLWEDANIRMNEGGTAPDGSLWCGGMAYDRTPGASDLYHVTPAGEATIAVADVSTSNGIDVSPDGTLAYYNDTGTKRTDVFTLRGSVLSNRRPFVAFPDDVSPDGLNVDSAGNVWIAVNKAGAVRLYSPAGEQLDEVTLPAHLTTACTLGGEDGRDLFVTTSRENLDDPEPEAGAVFKIRVDVPGKAVTPFAG